MPDISALNGTAIDNVAEFDGLTVTDVAPTFVGLLDETYGSGAAAAYSTRRLATATSVLLRVRRDTAGGTGDDDEADVGFDSNNVLSLDSPVSNFSAGGSNATTLGEFLNVGTVNSITYTDADSLSPNTAAAYVSEWKDQSTRGNDLTQGTFSSQPLIHDGTTDQDLEKENGYACLDVSATQEMAVSSINWSDGTQKGDAYSVVKFTSIPSTGNIVQGAFYGMGSNIQNSLIVNTITNRGTKLRALSSSIYDGPTVATGTNYLTYHRSAGTYTTGVSLASAINGGSLAGNSTSGLNWTGMHLNLDNYAAYRMNELVVFNPPSDTDRTDIEGNINAHFQIGNFGTPTSGLLFDYPDAAAAYSVRQLANTAVLSMRVRRDTAGGTGDDDEADVLFDFTLTDPTISLDSRINNASAGVASTTLGEFLNATGYTDVDSLGTVADGFCGTFYDQSGAGNDAEQTAFGSQPQIFDSASPTDLIQENGKPALQHQDLNGGLEISYTGNNPTTIAAVMANLSGGGNEPIPIINFSSGVPYAFRCSPIGNLNSAYRGFGTSPNSFLNGVEDTDLLMTEVAAAFGSAQGLVIGIGDSSGWTGSSTYLGWNDPQMFQEVIFWPSDQDTAGNITGIETNINDYFSIY